MRCDLFGHVLLDVEIYSVVFDNNVLSAELSHVMSDFWYVSTRHHNPQVCSFRYKLTKSLWYTQPIIPVCSTFIEAIDMKEHNIETLETFQEDLLLLQRVEQPFAWTAVSFV
jgi:hypothetical protein